MDAIAATAVRRTRRQSIARGGRDTILDDFLVANRVLDDNGRERRAVCAAAPSADERGVRGELALHALGAELLVDRNPAAAPAVAFAVLPNPEHRVHREGSSKSLPGFNDLREPGGVD